MDMFEHKFEEQSGLALPNFAPKHWQQTLAFMKGGYLWVYLGERSHLVS